MSDSKRIDLSRGWYCTVTKEDGGIMLSEIYNKEGDLVQTMHTLGKPEKQELEKIVNHCGGSVDVYLGFGDTRIGLCYQCKARRLRLSDEKYIKAKKGGDEDVKPCRFSIDHH